jgi:hypothetical protein
VLSVFVDTSTADPATGSAWRVELNRALARLDAMPPRLSSGERTARDLCMAHLRTALEGIRRAPGRPAWVAYVTTDDVVAAGPVRGRLETGVFWQNGVVVGPLRSALAEPRAVAVAGPDEVTGRLDAAMGGIAATLPSPLVGSSNAGTSSHATPACGFVACR